MRNCYREILPTKPRLRCAIQLVLFWVVAILGVILALSISGTAFAACPATDSFSGSNVPLNSANWTNYTGGSISGTISQVSGLAEVTTSSETGYAAWSQSGCTPGTQQSLSVAGATLSVSTSNYTGIGIMGTATGGNAGQGYIWLVGQKRLYKLTAGTTESFLISGGCPTPTSGHTYTLADTIVSSLITITLYDNGVATCYGQDYGSNAILTGQPFMFLQYGDQVGPVTINNAPLAAPTISPNGGPFPSTQAVTLSGPAGATIGYTTDGTTPTCSAGVCSGGTTQTYSTTFTLSATATVTAISSESGQVNSFTSAATFTKHTRQVWYIRPGGGTRYSSNATSGQCNGLYDVDYPGTGVNQNCAYNDFRYLYDDDDYTFGWVIGGGDQVINRGCNALSGQQNPSNPHCRIGWDNSTNSDGAWCYGLGANQCYAPPIPQGSATYHTQFLGQNYASCNTGGATNPKLYESNLTQLFGGFGLGYVLNLENTQYVDFECLEITAHNGTCSTEGSPSVGGGCSNASPFSDYAYSGILMNNGSSNVTFQDVYVHGFNSNGMFGPIGGPITMTRMFIGFNTFAGWNFDDGHDTPDAPGSSITANHVIMEGNGCQEEYPIVDAFPVATWNSGTQGGCYSTSSEGFGDSWSGQDTVLSSFSCNDCQQLYNTKDGFIGPHTAVANLTITNSQSIGNGGQQWKWGGYAVPTTVIFQNNLTVGNCNRFTQALTGAPAAYNTYFADPCRAGGAAYANVFPAGSLWTESNNTTICPAATCISMACPEGQATCPGTFTLFNNIWLAYNDTQIPDYSGEPGLYYLDPSITPVVSYSIEGGAFKSGSTDCPTSSNHIYCGDPQFLNEPSQTWVQESQLDPFSYVLHTSSSYLASASSPAYETGTNTGCSTDFFDGTTQTNPCTMGILGIGSSGATITITGAIFTGTGITITH